MFGRTTGHPSLTRLTHEMGHPRSCPRPQGTCCSPHLSPARPHILPNAPSVKEHRLAVYLMEECSRFLLLQNKPCPDSGLKQHNHTYCYPSWFWVDQVQLDSSPQGLSCKTSQVVAMVGPPEGICAREPGSRAGAVTAYAFSVWSLHTVAPGQPDFLQDRGVAEKADRSWRW